MIIDEDGYRDLVRFASSALEDGDWTVLLLGEDGERYLASEAAKKDGPEAQVKALQLAGLSGAAAVYVLHRRDDRVDVHLPGYCAGGQWHFDRGFSTPLFESAWSDGSPLFQPTPRRRPSALAQHRLALA